MKHRSIVTCCFTHVGRWGRNHHHHHHHHHHHPRGTHPIPPNFRKLRLWSSLDKAGYFFLRIQTWSKEGVPLDFHEHSWFHCFIFELRLFTFEVLTTPRTLQSMPLHLAPNRSESYQVHSLKLTFSPPKMMVSNRNLLFQWVIFRCHVSFREGIGGKIGV